MITDELNKRLQALDSRFLVWIRDEKIFSDHTMNFTAEILYSGCLMYKFDSDSYTFINCHSTSSRGWDIMLDAHGEQAMELFRKSAEVVRNFTEAFNKEMERRTDPLNLLEHYIEPGYKAETIPAKESPIGKPMICFEGNVNCYGIVEHVTKLFFEDEWEETKKMAITWPKNQSGEISAYQKIFRRKNNGSN